MGHFTKPNRFVPVEIAVLSRNVLVMFRSSVAAFYALPRCIFYRHGAVHCCRFNIHFVRLHVRLEVKKIVHRMSEILFADEIPFRCLDRGMPE
jgi:hypothetical protein